MDFEWEIAYINLDDLQLVLRLLQPFQGWTAEPYGKAFSASIKN